MFRYDWVSRYRYVSLYKINKKNNVSSVELCITPAGRISERDRNYDPVQGSYHELWREYELLDSPIPLMNVMRRILEHYFKQLCGYDSAAMSTKALEAVKKKIDEESNGMGPDYTKYHLAGAMLSYIRHTDSFNEGLYFVDESIDCDQYRDVFHTIFYGDGSGAALQENDGRSRIMLSTALGSRIDYMWKASKLNEGI